MVKKHTAPFSDTPPHPSAAFESDTSANKTSDMWGGVGTIAPLPHISHPQMFPIIFCFGCLAGQHIHDCALMTKWATPIIW